MSEHHLGSKEKTRACNVRGAFATCRSLTRWCRSERIADTDSDCRDTDADAVADTIPNTVTHTVAHSKPDPIAVSRPIWRAISHTNSHADSCTLSCAYRSRPKQRGLHAWCHCLLEDIRTPQQVHRA